MASGGETTTRTHNNLMLSACKDCGALFDEDHKKDCQTLADIKSIYYPQVVDDNGSPWYLNAIRDRDKVISSLRSQQEEPGDSGE